MRLRNLSPKRRALGLGVLTLHVGIVAMTATAQDSTSPGEAGDPTREEAAATEPESSASKTRGIEEILITSQGREQPLQEAAISAAAFDEEYLSAIGAQNISDIAQFTPNLEIRTVFAATNPTLFIRGVGLRDFNANSASSVAVYNDDIYMNSPAGQLGQLFDVQMVEVLRGPQGSLYGRNASAGVIKVVARKPTGDFNGYTNISYGNYNLFEVEGAVEAPVWGDMLSTRISGRMNLRDGTTHNRCGDSYYSVPDPNPTGVNPSLTSFRQRVHTHCWNPQNVLPIDDMGEGWVVGQTNVEEWVNNRDNWAARWMWRLQPNEDIDFNLNLHGGQNRGQTRQFQLIPASQVGVALHPLIGGADSNQYIDPDAQRPVYRCQRRQCALQRLEILSDPADGNPFEGDYNLVGLESLDIWGASITGEYTAGDWRFLSISGYEANQRAVATNLDANPYIGLEPTLTNESYQLTQDLKVFWESDSDLTGQFGLSFLYEDLHVDNHYDVNPIFTITQIYDLQTFYGSPYFFLVWEPSEEFSIEGGARFNVESKEMSILTQRLGRVNGLPQPGESGLPQVGFSDVTEYAPSGDVAINFRPTEDITFYAKYSRGWKGPHINGLILNPEVESDEGTSITSPVKPESVNAVELGVKSMWFSQRLKFNIAAFYYDYDDIQVFQLRNSAGSTPVQQLINANDADNYGLEAEIEARPFEGWAPEPLEGLMVYLTAAWLQNSYTDFVNQLTATNIGGSATASTEDFSGNQLINSPEFSFAGYLQWDVRLDRWGTLSPRLDWTYKDQVFFSPANEELVGQPPLWLFNLRFAYRTPGDNIEIAGWVRNLTNEVYRLDVFNLARFRKEIAYAMGDPRTFGLTLSVRF